MPNPRLLNPVPVFLRLIDRDQTSIGSLEAIDQRSFLFLCDYATLYAGLLPTGTTVPGKNCSSDITFSA